MATHPGEIAVTGTVIVSTRLNVRQGAPSTLAPVLRKQDSGTQLSVIAIAAGDEVQGNRLWFELPDGAYIWSGACGQFQPGPISAIPAAATLLPQAPAPLIGTQFPAAHVVDIYHLDMVQSFDAARAGGVLGIIHKATTGKSGRDGLYPQRRAHAQAAGLLWGAYHWGTAAPVADQVKNFLEWADPDDHTLVALDFEKSEGNQMTLAQAREFLKLIEQKLGRKAVLYSGATIKEQLGAKQDPFFAGHRLWLSQYGPKPEVQASWDAPWLWQFTEGKAKDPRRRIVPGIPGNSEGELDCNHYSGTAEQLADEWAS